MHHVTKTITLLGLLALWTIQYAAWVPSVWIVKTIVALAKFATHSAGYIVLLILFPIGWIVLAILMTRNHPQTHTDRTYLHPWFRR